MDGDVTVVVVVIEGAGGCEDMLVAVGVGFVSGDVTVVVVVDGCETALLGC